MPKIKVWWAELSKKQKVIFGIFVSLIIISAISFSIYYFVKPKDNLSDDGNWEKLQIPDRPAPSFVLAPKVDKKFGISANETFVLVSKTPTTEDQVREILSASKPVKVSQKSETEFEITPVAKLSPDETIQLTVSHDNQKYNWAFQVAPKLKIVDSLPRNNALNVPVNAGIEITFNTDNYDNFVKEIEVLPKFDFRTEKHDQKLVIVPTNPLNFKSEYMVSIKSMDYSFSFQTADVDNNGRLTLNNNFQQVLPNEQLQTKVNASIDKNSSIKTEVFKFSNSVDFIDSRKKIDQITSSWKSYYGEMNKIDLTNLSKISEVNLSIQIQDQLNYLQLPFNLNEGFYFIQFTYSNGEKSEHLWVQSTPILGYVSVAREQSMVWINSLNNEPINESRVSVVGTTDTYTTNNEGWAAFPTQESLFDKSKHYIQIVTTTGKELILPITTLGDKAKPNQKTQSDYWSYLYNERILYKPTDTIYFWGVAKDKDTGNIPSSVVVGLGSYDKPVEFSETIVPNQDGSFIGRLDLKDFETGSYNLKAFVDNVEIASSYLSISDFIKPEFKIELTTDKKAIFSDEKAVFNGKIGFFDGTPASNIPLKIYQSFGGENKNLDANKKGEFSYDYLSKYDSNGSYPRYESITVSPQTATQGESEEYGTVLVYGSKLKIDSSSKQEGSVATVKAKVSNIDLDRINVQGLDDPMSGPAKKQKVNIVTEKTWYEQKEKGTYYDFVEKVTRKTYDYVNHTEKVESKDLITDGNGEINYSINLEKDKSFSVILTVTDNAGHLNSTRQYFYYYDGYSNGNDNKKAELVIDKKENTFSVGEEVKLKITKNGELYKDSDTNKFLFVLANRGRQEVFVRDNPGLSFNFEDKYKPNIFIGSIIFNGKYYEEVTSNCYQDWMCGGYDYYNQYVFTPVEVIYQKNDSKLELSIQVDKTKYAPGDKASVSVLVTKDNNPVSNATVNLVLVDEALAAMGKVNKPFALDALYKHVNSFVYYNYYTHQPVKPDGPMAERGGGGGDRNIFKDTAFFNVASTNEAGVAEFKFDLPDNITNWLTYAQAVTSGVDAGIGDSSIVSTKEFFVTSQFPKVVTLMDNPYLSANSYGISLTNTNDSIDAEFVFSNDSSELSKNKFKLVPFKESYIAFPKLGAGNYKVTVSGKYQNIEDGITLPVSVIDSRLEFRMFEDLEKSKNIEFRKDKPLKLIVTDEGRSKYYYDLLNYCYISSNRIEKILAGLFAKSILESNFDEKECGENSNLLSEFQSSDGGLRQVRWGNSDLESTFWAVYIDASKFNKEELTKYFESFSNSSWSKNIDKVMANWGLTILGKPQINNLVVLSKQATTFKEKVISALALNYIGQNEEAKNIYFELLGVYGYTNKPYIRIQAGSSMDNYLMDTGYMLLLSSKLNTEYNEGMNLYLRDYRTEATGVILEVSNISFIDSELTKLPKVDTEVSIKSKYQNKTIDLSKAGNLNINLKTDELDSLEVKTLKGKSESQISYFATNDQFDKLKGDKRLKLKKTISKVRGDGDELRLGDILQIRLEYDFDNDAPKGCYDLTDHIPSGLTRIDNPNAYG
ncbi:hypothetical protein KBD45_07290, partial [Candidatus Dojkabacteria bacterium]|nr:hypothetical protein [Candidatus Dojkabacteria bacterium]